jgi:hypothetical protein
MLEGFDDPFTTLQMVAEFFRNLTAEDRCFGETPQTPDATTLKNIAQKIVQTGLMPWRPQTALFYGRRNWRLTLV